MKLAIIGGSFNPLHIGHAMLADTMLKEYGYDKVLFVPTCIPPHKEITEGASTAQRVEMVRRFCSSIPGNVFECETCEVDRGGVSYTVDTLQYICGKYKELLEGKPAFLMGTEIAAEFEKWKSPDLIAEIADLVIVPRYPDMTKGKLDHKNKPSGHYNGDFSTEFNPQTFKYRFKLLENPMVPVSSTEIRTRVSQNKSFKYLVPQAVYDYILEQGLYK